MAKEPTTIHLDKFVYSRIKDIARKRGLPISKLTNEILTKALPVLTGDIHFY